MGIVRFALRFPHTFYVLAALILFLGVAAIRTMPTDIFPEIRHSGGHGDLAVHRPQHAGDGAAGHHLQPVRDQLQRQRHQEHGSADLNGISVQKIYFQPDVNLDLAISQIVAATNASARSCRRASSRRSSCSSTPRACRCCRSV